MTTADLPRIARALEAERARWAEVLLARVDRTLADAHAHATKAITETLKATADGRPTFRKATRSSSFQAALNRLDELRTWLAGPSNVSLDGRVRDARAAFYRLAFALHAPLIPTGLRVRPDPAPTQDNINLIRAAPIHGYDPRVELEKPFADAARQLSAAVTRAGAQVVTRAAERDLLKAWHDRARRAIGQAVLTLLSDSLEYCTTEAMADLIHPDYRT